jgi:hypothetical protein
MSYYYFQYHYHHQVVVVPVVSVTFFGILLNIGVESNRHLAALFAVSDLHSLPPLTILIPRERNE